MSEGEDDYSFHGIRATQNSELHVYVVPPQLWPERQRFSAHRVTRDFASAGFIRVNNEMTLEEARREIAFHLSSGGNLPSDFQFVRDVDRRLVQITSKQERQLKTKHFLPPNSESAALFVIDKRVVDGGEKNFISGTGSNAMPRGHATRPSSYDTVSQKNDERSREQFRQKAGSVHLPRIDAKSRQNGLPSYMQMRDLDLQARDYISRQALRNQTIDQRVSRLQDQSSVHSFDENSPRVFNVTKNGDRDRRLYDVSNQLGHSQSLNALNDGYSIGSQHARRSRPSFSPERTEASNNRTTHGKSGKSYWTPRGSRRGQFDYFYFLTGAFAPGGETPVSASNRSTPPQQDMAPQEVIIQSTPSPQSTELDRRNSELDRLERDRRNSELERLERERQELDEIERRERERIAREEADKRSRDEQERRKRDDERRRKDDERRRMEEDIVAKEQEFKLRLEQELAAKRAEIERLQKIRGDLQSNLEDLYEAKQTKDAEEEQKLAELKKKKDDTQTRLENEKSLKMGEMENAIKQLSGEIQDLEDSVQKQRSSNENEQRELLERRRQLEEELQQAEERAKDGLARLEAEMKEALQKLEDERLLKEREFEENKRKQQQEFEAIQQQLAQIELQRTQLEREYAKKQEEAQQRLKEEYEMRQKEWQAELDRIQQENARFKSVDEERRRKLEDEVRKFEEEKVKLEENDASLQKEAQQRLLKLLEDNERKRQEAEEELRKRQKLEEEEYQEQLKRFEDEKRSWQEQIERRKAEEEKRRVEMEQQFKEEEERRQREHEAQLQEIEIRMRAVRTQYEESQKMFIDEIQQYKDQEQRLQQETAEAIRLAQQGRRLPADLNLPDLVDSRGDPNALAKEKQRLLEERQRLRERRIEAERKREALVKEAKKLQMLANGRRNQVRDNWKKRYFEEKKKTPVLEDQLERLKAEFDQIHQKLLGHLSSYMQSSPQNNFLNSLIFTGDNRPSESNNLRIQAARVKHDIMTLQRDVDNAKLRLAAEAKLRIQAESELRALRAESMHKRTTTNVIRNLNSSMDVALQAASNFNSPRFNELAMKLSPRFNDGSPELRSFRLNFPSSPATKQGNASQSTEPVRNIDNESTNRRRNQIFEDIRETDREHDEANKPIFGLTDLNSKAFKEPSKVAERA